LPNNDPKKLSLEDRAKDLTDILLKLTNKFQSLKCDESRSGSDCNLRELRVLNFLRQNGPSNMRGIAEYFDIALSTVTDIVDRLVRKELVTREWLKEDRRVVKVELSKKGRKEQQQLLDLYIKFSIGVLQSLCEEDQNTFLILMHNISQAVE